MESDLTFMKLLTESLIEKIPDQIHQRSTCSPRKIIVGFKCLEQPLLSASDPGAFVNQICLIYLHHLSHQCLNL